MKTKAIKEYFKSAVFFCFAVKFYIFYIIACTIFVILSPVAIIFDINKILIPIQEKFFNISDYELQELNNIIEIFAIPSSFIALYFLAKIFGIFKKLDRVNFFLALLIITILSLILVGLGKINILMPQELYEMGVEYGYMMYLLIPAFLLYKFFNFLTKKFPFPFKKIGCYFSIDFYKNLYEKIRSSK